MPPLKLSTRARAALVAALLLLAALGALALWGRSESALRWAAGQAAAWSGGRVTLEGVSGSVLGPLRVARLGYRSPDAEVTAEGVEADWSPARLLLGRALHISRLQAARVEVVVKPGDAPLQAPADLGPPLPFRLARISVPRLELRGPGAEVLLQDLNASLEADAGAYRLRLSSLRFPGAGLSGRASLGAAKPFALEGEIAATAAYAGETFLIPLRLSGTLEAVGLAASVDHPWGKAALAASLAPFGDEPLRALRAELSGVDPSRHGKGWPGADLAATLDAAAAAGGLAGEIHIENRAPGRLDQDRLPLERVRTRVALAGGELRLDELVLGLAGAGTLEGAGRVAPDRAEFRLRSSGLALHALHAALKPLRPAGTLALTATREQQDVQADFAAGEYRARLDARHRDGVLTLRSAALRARGSALEAAGELRLDAAREFSATGTLRDFNPAQWGEFPGAKLNARLEAQGRLAPGPRGTLRYRLLDSQYGGAPLSGEGVLGYEGREALGAEGHLALGANRLDFRGGLGPGERLAWSLEAAALSALGPEFSGKGTASGWFAGSLDSPSFQFDLRANRLRLPGGLAAGALQAGGEFAPGADGVMHLRLEAQQLRLGGHALDALQAAAEGTASRHEFSVAARGAGLDLEARAEGGIADGSRWIGTLVSLAMRKPEAGSLAAPAALAVGRDHLEIGAAELRLGSARLSVERVSWRDGRLASRGRFSALPLGLVMPRAADAPWQSDLTFSGDWDLDLGTAVNGDLRVARESGDLRLGTGKPVYLGLSRASLEARARDSALQVSAGLEGSRLGSLQSSFNTRLERGEAGWRLPREAPLGGELRGRVPSLAWLGPLLDPILATEGVLEISANASGTVGDPVLDGRITGQGLEAHVDQTGLHLTRGTLAAEFTGDRLVVRELTLRGGEGTLATSGAVSFAGGRRQGALDFGLERLAIVDMPGQKLEVSGKGKLDLEGARLALSGAIRADRGLIELRDWDRPRLSDDVVIAGRERAQPGGGAAPGLRLALDLDLGERFRVRGTGLDARLVGAIQVRSDDGPTKARGVVRVAEGSYAAYGQRLQIERGALMFDGQITNPALDILALRKNQRVEAGVAITGTVLSPRTRLVSFPPVPDAEKLSWLVLGQGTGARDDSALSLPALGAAAKDDEYVSVGAQLTSSLYVGIGRSVTGTGTLLKLTYILSERWSVQTRSGDASGASIFYTISFE
jgi:translocation and assembly module TamB